MRRTLPIALLFLLIAAAVGAAWLALRDVGAPRTEAPAIAAPARSGAIDEPGGPAGARIETPSAGPTGGARARVTSPGATAPADDEALDIGGIVYAVDEDDWVELPGARVVLLDDAAPRPESPDVRPSWADTLDPGFPRTIPSRVVGETVTDAEGAFRFAASLRGRVVRVEAEGRRTVHRDAEEDLEIGLDRPHVVRLRVVDRDGAPIAGATLYVADWDGLPPNEILTTDEGGRATAQIAGGDDEESAAVLVVAAGYGTELRYIVGDTTIRLGPARTISGVVVDDRGAPVPGAWVRSWESYEPPVPTGANGEFVLGALPEATWSHTIVVAAEGYSYREFEAVPGTSGLRIELVRPARLTGRVFRADGSVAAGATVRVWGPGTTTTEDGSFELEVQDPGEDTVVAQLLAPQEFDLSEFPRPYGEGAELQLALHPGETLADVVLRMAEIPESYLYVRGVAPGGAVLEGVSVSVAGTLDKGLPESQGMRVGGWFRRVPVEPGGVVFASVFQTGRDDLGNHVQVELTTRAQPEGEADRVEFPLLDDNADIPVAEITLVVVGPDGRTLPPGSIGRWNVAFAGPEIPRAGARPDGAEHDPASPTRVVRACAGRDYTVDVDAPGFGSRSFALSDPPEGPSRVDLRLDAAATIVGRLVGAPDEIAAASVEVLLVAGAGEKTSAWVGGEEGLSADGRFRITDLAAGRARLVVWDFDVEHVIAERRFDTTAGQVIDLGDIRLDTLPWVRGSIQDGQRPVPGALVAIEDDDTTFTAGSTDDRGAFALRAPVRPGLRLVVTALSLDGDAWSVAYDLEDVVRGGGRALAPPASGWLRVRHGGGVPEGAELVRTIMRTPGGPRVLADASGLFGDGDVIQEIFALPLGVVEIASTLRLTDGTEVTWRGTADVPRDDREVEVTLQR